MPLDLFWPYNGISQVKSNPNPETNSKKKPKKKNLRKETKNDDIQDLNCEMLSFHLLSDNYLTNSATLHNLFLAYITTHDL